MELGSKWYRYIYYLKEKYFVRQIIKNEHNNAPRNLLNQMLDYYILDKDQRPIFSRFRLEERLKTSLDIDMSCAGEKLSQYK